MPDSLDAEFLKSAHDVVPDFFNVKGAILNPDFQSAVDFLTGTDYRPGEIVHATRGVSPEVAQAVFQAVERMPTIAPAA